jgi:PadR family transcriptional regulator, regulatory protein AphA
MELSATAYVVLGMLRERPRSGYEIKQVVDQSTRFFWAASYGQIYPELKRLADAGLVKGEADPQGERKRTRYRLTPAGRKELRRWLEQPPETFEMRDEGLLKLFFSVAASPESAAGSIAAKRRYHEDKIATLRALEPLAKSATDPYPHMVLRHGIELSEWTIAWCERIERELARETKRKAA